MNDYATLLLGRRRAQFEDQFGLALPPQDSLLLARNKHETVRLAERLGIPTPPSWLAENAEELAAVAAKVRYPCVAKLVRGAGAVGMRVAQSPAELLVGKISGEPGADTLFDASAYVVQEWLEGQIYDVCSLFCDGEPRAALVQKRNLMYPARGGAGVWNETVERPELLEPAFALLRELRWHGPSQVEFLVDAEGRAFLIEVNGRFWGTLDLAIAAGIDFPSLTCRLAADGDVSSAFDYSSGMGFRWPVPLGWLQATSSGHLAANLWRFLVPRTLLGRGSVTDLRSDLRISDPVPHLAELLYLAQLGWERRSLRTGPRQPE